MNCFAFNRLLLCFATLGSMLFCWNAKVHGQVASTSQIDALQRQIDALRAEVGEASSPTDQRNWNVASHNLQTPLSSSTVGMPMVHPGVEEKSYPDFKVTGFFQLDSAYFGQSSGSINTLGDIQDGAGFRRARLAATGSLTERSSYMMEFDMAQGQARFVDVWGQVKETPFGNMRIGRFRQPFGMSELTGVRELPFLERPTAFAISPFRQTGIMFSNTALDQTVTWAASGFRTISDNFGNVYGDDGGYGTAERVTFLAADHGDTGLLHFGLDHSYLDPARNTAQIASQDEIFLSQQPNFGPGGLSVLPILNVPPFVNSGVFAVDHLNLYNVEAAASLGRTLLQSEYRWANLAMPSGENVTVQGGYAMVRYMLTGETIPYNRSNGVFGRVKPNCPLDFAKGQWGAWELAGRFTTLNLNPLFGVTGVSGPTRRLNSIDLGLNWYWWTNAKTQLNWLNGNLTDPAVGKSISNTIACRVQFDF